MCFSPSEKQKEIKRALLLCGFIGLSYNKIANIYVAYIWTVFSLEIYPEISLKNNVLGSASVALYYEN